MPFSSGFILISITQNIVLIIDTKLNFDDIASYCKFGKFAKTEFLRKFLTLLLLELVLTNYYM